MGEGENGRDDGEWVLPLARSPTSPFLLLRKVSAVMRTIAANASVFRLAPPINAPSMSGIAISSPMFFSLALPPYWMRMACATDGPYNSAIVPRTTCPQTRLAVSEVAVLPVPMAQIGS